MSVQNNDEELLEWMRSADVRSLEHRLERLKFLRQQYDSEHYDCLNFGGLVSVQAFEEMQFCYIHGAYVACILVGQATLEHLLAGLLDWNNCTNVDLRNAGFATLSAAAFERGLISQTEFDECNELRSIRNPYVHPRVFWSTTDLMRRSAEGRCPPDELLRADAEKAIKTVIGILSRPPFAFPTQKDGEAG